MSYREEKVTRIIREVRTSHNSSLPGYMAGAALSELENAWKSYGADVRADTIRSDIEDARSWLRRMADEVDDLLKREGVS